MNQTKGTTARRTMVRTAGRIAALALSIGVIGGLSPAAQVPAGPAAAQVPAGQATAQDLSRRAAERIAALQKEADGLAARERTLINDLRRLEVERNLRAERFKQSQRGLAATEADLTETAARISRLEARARTQSPALTARLVELYKLGQAGYVRLMLSVDDLREAGRAYRFVSALQQIDHQRAADHGRTLADLRTARAALETRRAEQLALHAQVGLARGAADRAAADQAALVQQVDRRRDLAAQLVGELQAAREQLERRLADFEHGGNSAPAIASLPIGPFRGDLDWPAEGTILATFGRQRNTRFNTAVVSNGIRIAASTGTPVHAIHEGTVVFAEPFSGFGNLLIIDHGGQAFSMYGTLDAMAVPAGGRVARGDVIGTAGAAIDGTPSLYFELRVDGRPVDPLQWLRKR